MPGLTIDSANFMALILATKSELTREESFLSDRFQRNVLVVEEFYLTAGNEKGGTAPTRIGLKM